MKIMTNQFKETQYQRNPLPWILVFIIWGISIWVLSTYNFNNNFKIIDTIILFILPSTLTILLIITKLSIIVDKYYLKYRFFPLQWNYKKIQLSEIFDVIIKNYNNNRIFSGWGYKIFKPKNYISYTIAGNKGVEITLKSGKKIFLGSLKTTQLKLKILNNIKIS